MATCRFLTCIENERKGEYTSSHAPYTRFTSVLLCVHGMYIKFISFIYSVICLLRPSVGPT